MSNDPVRRSLFLCMLMLLTSLSLALSAIPAVSAGTNETNGSPGNDVVTGLTEVWQGSHTLVGAVTVAEGAKLTINAGATITFAAGAYLDVHGALCVGDSACQAISGGSIQFNWNAPADDQQPGWCDGMQTATNKLASDDASCGEGLVLRSTVDTAISGIKNLAFANAYGFPIEPPRQPGAEVSWEYAALVFEGASINADGLSFTNINTSSVLVTEYASPVLSNGQFIVGNDQRGFIGPAISAYRAGSGIQASLRISNSEFTGTQLGCEQNSGARSTIWITESYVDFETLDFSDKDGDGAADADYGVYMRSSAGEVTDSNFLVECSAFTTNSIRSIGDIDYPIFFNSSIIETASGAGAGFYDGGLIYLDDIDITGASAASGISARSVHMEIRNSNIHDITGYNGLFLRGESEVVVENTTFSGIALEPVMLGEYHWDDDNWNTDVSEPIPARLRMVNSTVNNTGGTCNSDAIYGGDFICPSIHVYMGSATLWDNTINEAAGDAIRVTGGVVDARRNTATAGEFGVRIASYDTKYALGSRAVSGKYGSIGYFSGNIWGTTSQTYNITESRVAVQSESIPVPTTSGEFAIGMRWLGSSVTCEPVMVNHCLQVPPMYSSRWEKSLFPRDFPMAPELVANATIFAYADLDIDLDDIHIGRLNSGAGPQQNQVQEGELVRYRVLSNGATVPYADVTVKDSHGRELYNLTTDQGGLTPRFVLPSDFHLDFRGLQGGDNPDGLVTDAAENSCNDGIDNDGDLLYDQDDPDCAAGSGTREMSVYFIDAWRFDKGSQEVQLTLSSSVDGVIELENLRPSVGLNVEFSNGTSFKRWINVSGSAYDGAGEIGYSSDWEAMLGQMGTVDSIDVRVPGGSWDDNLTADDDSGVSDDMVTRYDWPWKKWSFEFDLSTAPEGDYTFEFRAFDGVEYSDIMSRTYQLNTVPPTVTVSSPSDGSTHTDDVVHFTGTAFDSYNGLSGSDLHQLHFKFTRDDGQTLPMATTVATSEWQFDWDFSAHPTGTYVVDIWASDSNFCRLEIGECTPVTLTIGIDTENAVPIVEIYGPEGTIQASEQTLITGWATDSDGEVFRIEVDVIETSTGIRTSLPNVYQFAGDGTWELEWDTSSYDHLSQYQIEARSFDGTDYSVARSVLITVSNPTDVGNMPPEFNSTAWSEIATYKIYCDRGSKAQGRCGFGLEFDLNDYFKDPEGKPLNFAIDGDAADFNEHDVLMFSVIHISQDGIVTYQPEVDMGSHYSEETQWSFLDVTFIAWDEFDYKVKSDVLNIIVVPVDFTFEIFNSGAVDDGNPAVFVGTGRPGETVKAYLTRGHLPLNETVVDADGNWRMVINRNLFPSDGGSIDVTFVYASTDYELAKGVNVEGQNSGMAWWAISLIVIGLLVAILGILAYFFVEFEDEEDEFTMQGEEPKEDPYAWGRERQQQEQQAAAAQQQAAAAQQYQPQGLAQPDPQPTIAPQPTQPAQPASQHPGWQWDAQTQQWVPDGSQQPPHN